MKQSNKVEVHVVVPLTCPWSGGRFPLGFSPFDSLITSKWMVLILWQNTLAAKETSRVINIMLFGRIPSRKPWYLFALVLEQLIFNSKLGLASPKPATDEDYAAILGVIGHELSTLYELRFCVSPACWEVVFAGTHITLVVIWASSSYFYYQAHNIAVAQVGGSHFPSSALMELDDSTLIYLVIGCPVQSFSQRMVIIFLSISVASCHHCSAYVCSDSLLLFCIAALL
ncbi:hypothetical protein Vadar_024261 [Vaccinium darrowii]|uniref:Uncharacterized protein n=1 Tax=Vaccinium darrowii TaxID=229202 RepID=A0ACB7Y1J4_9ERIC|nr:hypothetical protein Vadar_024261 [Vaccinium darrowii]